MTSSPAASLSMFTIDCARPAELAHFYASVLGWDITYSDDDYAMLSGPGAALGFGRVADLQPASWPDTDSAKRFHLDLRVDDLRAGESRMLELGGKVPEFQPGGERWRVILDPEGQPFCISAKPAG